MLLDTLQLHKLCSKLHVSPFKLHDHLFVGKVRPFEQPGFLFVGNSSEMSMNELLY